MTEPIYKEDGAELLKRQIRLHEEVSLLRLQEQKQALIQSGAGVAPQRDDPLSTMSLQDIRIETERLHAEVNLLHLRQQHSRLVEQTRGVRLLGLTFTKDRWTDIVHVGAGALLFSLGAAVFLAAFLVAKAAGH